ncbi:MAG: hypothetical protein ACREPD_21520 [Stenotrophomonas sp.]|uniref:hypothetical protein n=1 Tax=Gammaproteobacteria TaxID=1236 RepID=UPI003D6D0EDB
MDDSKPAAAVIELAAQIADKTVRCDIELFCRDTWVDGVQYFDVTAPRLFGEDLTMVRDALEYIQLRGDVFPWAMQRHPLHPQWVRFEEKA